MIKTCCLCILALMWSTIGKAQESKKDSSKTEFVSMESLPEFPGGTEAFSEYLSKNVKYPKKAFKNKVEGRVNVTFVVEKDGSLSDVKAIGTPDPLLVDEAVRVIKISPSWKPGIQDGKVVRVQFTVPIVFKL